MLSDEATDRRLRNRVRAASQPPPPPLSAQFAVGQRVEVAQTDEGMLGAWFGCTILEIKPGVTLTLTLTLTLTRTLILITLTLTLTRSEPEPEFEPEPEPEP